MSTDFRLEKRVCAADVLDGRLNAFDIREHLTKETTEMAKCLTDGRNYIWLYIDDAGLVSSLSRYGRNAPSKILEAISTTFDTDIFSEYEPQFWGFSSQEEWDTEMEKMKKEDDDIFYAELIKYLHGEPNDINPHTIGEAQALIAKKLTAADPELLIPAMREKLIAAVEEIYESDHAVKVKLTKEDLAFVQMVGTHEDDMGRA
jgi:hypothetical protein